MPDAIVLFAHGSRDPLWRTPIESVARAIAARHPHTPVRCAYLELCDPDLPTVAAQLIAAYAPFERAGGSKPIFSIRIVPMFLGMGKHAREDLPALVHALQAQYPQVHFEVVQPIGEDARVTALLADIAAG